jgi:hypothetical protein
VPYAPGVNAIDGLAVKLSNDVMTKYFRLLPICHGFWARPVAYYLKWSDAELNHIVP